MSNSLPPHGLQHTSLRCLSLPPGVCSDSHPLSQWCYLTILFILCRPILLLPSIFPSIRVFFNELALLIRWPKYCSFSISPSNEQSGLISFRIDWFGPYFTIQCFISKFFTCICLVRFLECGKDLILQRSQVWVRKHGWWGSGREGEQ